MTHVVDRKRVFSYKRLRDRMKWDRFESDGADLPGAAFSSRDGTILHFIGASAIRM